MKGEGGGGVGGGEAEREEDGGRGRGERELVHTITSTHNHYIVLYAKYSLIPRLLPPTQEPGNEVGQSIVYTLVSPSRPYSIEAARVSITCGTEQHTNFTPQYH